jgi:AraC family transcriptional regulator
MHPDVITPFAVEGLVVGIAEACRKRIKFSGLKHPIWLEQKREMLQDRFLDLLLCRRSPKRLASILYILHRYYRCSIGEYKRQLRVQLTCGEISKTYAPLSQIALAAGYSDQAHFSRTFKLLMGMNATEYRGNSRNT